MTATADLRTQSQAPLLAVHDLVRHFSTRQSWFKRTPQIVRAVDGVSCTVQAGETFAIVGESGCGKSTLGRLMLRLIEPTAGRVLFDGQDLTRCNASELRALRRSIQIVFQDPYSSLNPQMTIGDALQEPLWLHGLASGRAERSQKVAQLLTDVGLDPSHAKRFPAEFSGGQRQRICIARALAVEPRLIVCDEAVSALDVSVQAQIINLLQNLQQTRGLAYVFISHDLAVVRHIAHRVAVMYLGRIVEIAPSQTLFENPAHPYTQALLAAVPAATPRLRGAVRTHLQGDIPSPINPPGGCHFHTRCPHVRERCREQAPPLQNLGENRAIACHFWHDIRPSPRVEAPADNAHLAKLQAAFHPPVQTA